ncbi:SAM-dependent methyltransferase [Chlorella sorokiniana]|uniref:SAM-dependent methyltransferase n=1 Tax=Chlorella sorokiniana TaxID=3076 RepID=A0A2P6TQ17_CHLSO|nr:SAM-dependent methyltransferase [Chlorella sorokiniana]|eukprot:PRW56125.1 SAM-dependent methyltransferase [Chlorella sorokiniana]
MLQSDTVGWLLVCLSSALTDLAWRNWGHGSYLRLRELTASAMTLVALSPAASWLLIRQLLDDQAPRLAVGMAWASARPTAALALHLAHLLFASGALKMGINCISLPVRLSLSTALQAALLLLSLPHTATICAAAPLTHPVAQRTSHAMHSMLSMLASLGPIPAAAGAGAAKSAALHECVTLTLWLRVLVALLLPLLHAAAAEAQLWQRHQQERSVAHLPPEHSVAAPLYAAMLRLAASIDSLPHALVCGWGVLAVSWNWARLLAPLSLACAATG